MNGNDAIKAALDSSDLFAGLDPSVLRGHFTVNFRRGDPVSESQNGIDCVGVLVSGSLNVEASEGSSVSVMKRGGEFGICNVFVREGMPTKLWARVQSTVLFIPKDEFVRLLTENAGLLYRYLRLCNEKMIYLAQRLRLISIGDCTERLAHYLRTESRGGNTALRIPKDELARRLGISRASLFRALNTLSQKGVITAENGVITISPFI